MTACLYKPVASLTQRLPIPPPHLLVTFNAEPPSHSANANRLFSAGLNVTPATIGAFAWVCSTMVTITHPVACLQETFFPFSSHISCIGTKIHRHDNHYNRSNLVPICQKLFHTHVHIVSSKAPRSFPPPQSNYSSATGSGSGIGWI